MTIELMPHQNEGIEFLLEKGKAILGDDVGVGKTYQAIEAALCMTAGNRDAYILVIIPPHLERQWVTSLDRYGTDDRPVHLVGRYSAPTLELGPGIHLTSYPILYAQGRKAYPWLLRKTWDVVIADEAHRMRKPQTQTFKSFDLLAYRKLILMSGSVMENNAADIWALLHMCDRRAFRSYWDFVDVWMDTWQDPWKRNIIGVKEERLPLWETMLNDYMIRRLKKGVPWLPPVDVPVVPSFQYKRAHDKARDEWILEHPDPEAEDKTEYMRSAGAMIAKLRKLMSSDPAKQAALEAVMIDIPREAPVVVFCWYRDTAERLCHVLAEAIAPRTVVLAHGGTPTQERARRVEEWQAATGGEKGGPILIGTLKSIGEGLDLQQAAHCIFYEEDYLPGTLHQARGRIDRIGQQASHLTEYWIHSVGTIETHVHMIQEKRGSQLERALLESFLADTGNE